MENRLPQGSSMSVTLFLKVIYDISKHIKLPIKIIIYIDDCNIYCLRIIVSKWSSESGIKFLPEKCQTFYSATRRKSKFQKLNCKEYRITLSNTNSLRFLGQTIGYKINWIEYIKK